MSGEQQGARLSVEQQKIIDLRSEGEYFLKLFGFGELIDSPMPGNPDMQARDFLLDPKCAREALPHLRTYDKVKDNPRYQPLYNTLKNRMAIQLGITLEENN